MSTLNTISLVLLYALVALLFLEQKRKKDRIVKGEKGKQGIPGPSGQISTQIFNNIDLENSVKAGKAGLFKIQSFDNDGITDVAFVFVDEEQNKYQFLTTKL